MRSIRLVLGLVLVVSSPSVFPQPQFGHVQSLELLVFRADAVGVGTLESYELSADAKRIEQAAFRVDETLKGELGATILVGSDGREPNTFMDWIEGKSRALLFVQGGVASALPISGPLPQVMLADRTLPRSELTIIRAARRIAAQKAPEPLASIRFLLDRRTIEGWKHIGTITDLEVPITEELHRWAVNYGRRGDLDDKARAADVFAHYASESDIEMLRSMLDDKAMVYHEDPASNLGNGRGEYWVRKVAYEHLVRLGVSVERPQIEFTSFEPDEVRWVYLERDRNARAKLAKLGQFKNLRSLYIASSGTTDEDMKHIGGLSQLTELNATNNPLADAAMVEISKLKGLRILDLSWTGVTDDGLSQIAGLHSLEYLSLGRTKITDAGLAYIARLKNLKYLNVAETGVTLEGLRALRGLERLEEIEGLIVDWRQSDAYFESLGKNGLIHTHSAARVDGDARATKDSQVKEFWLYGGPIGDGLIRALQPLANLEELSLATTKVTDEGIRLSLGFKRLRTLVVNGTRVTDEGMRLVAEHRGLRSLGIADTAVTDDGLRALSGLDELEWIAISGTKVTNAGMSHLRKIESLRHIVMHNLSVGDEGIAVLAELPNVESVLLGRTEMTDRGLMLLAANKSIKTISFSSSRVTLEGLKALRRTRPDIELR